MTTILPVRPNEHVDQILPRSTSFVNPGFRAPITNIRSLAEQRIGLVKFDESWIVEQFMVIV